MTYSIIGILALIVLLITNRDILWHGRNAGRHQRYYRLFLLGVMAYYITDLLWGILDEWRMTAVLYADTAVHFAAMAAASAIIHLQGTFSLLHRSCTKRRSP